MQSLEDHQPDHQPRAQRSLTRTCRSPLQQFRYPCLRHHLQISFECPYQLRLCAILVKLTNSYGAKIRSIQSICADFCTFVQTLSTQPKICRLAAFAFQAAMPPFMGASKNSLLTSIAICNIVITDCNDAR